jgi:hypothetical protein
MLCRSDVSREDRYRKTPQGTGIPALRPDQLDDRVPESREAFGEITAFFDKHLGH